MQLRDRPNECLYFFSLRFFQSVVKSFVIFNTALSRDIVLRGAIYEMRACCESLLTVSCTYHVEAADDKETTLFLEY